MHTSAKLTFIFLVLLPISLYGQNTLTLTGGLTNSLVPIYTQQENTSVLSTQSVNKLASALGYNHKVTESFILKSKLAYKNLGANTLNKQVDQEDLFINSVLLEYLALSIIPFGEIKIGSYSVGGGLGPTTSFLLNERIENYALMDTGLKFIGKENIGLSKLDAGITGAIEINRVVANGLKLILTIEKYQSVLNVARNNLNMNNVFLSNSSINLGLEFPLKRKRLSSQLN